MEHNNIKRWALITLACLVFLTLLFSFRFYLLLSLPARHHDLISWSILILVLCSFISMIKLYRKITLNKWKEIKPLIATVLFIVLPVFIFMFSSFLKGIIIQYYCIAHEKQLNGIISYALQHHISYATSEKPTGSQNHYALYHTYDKKNKNDGELFYDRQLDSLLTDVPVKYFVLHDSTIFFNFYRQMIPCYGYGIAYTMRSEMKNKVPSSPNLCPIYGWYSLVDNWYYYSYLD
jgi:hypothetical protein